MALRLDDPNDEMLEHGGSLDRARADFPDAALPWIDLSTGINPHSYPVLPLTGNALSRLPEPADLKVLAAAAAAAYHCGDAGQIVPAGGTQMLLPFVMRLVSPGRARILGPTYAEHARCARLAGHEVDIVAQFDALTTADLAIIVNPNNPDGRICSREDLLKLASRLRCNNGLLVVDEAFMDCIRPDQSLAGNVSTGNIVVLRSFGKFFGLAGLRLGFAIAEPGIAKTLAAGLGPWPVSGPAIAYGRKALSDDGWQSSMRERIRSDADRLDAILASGELQILGGTPLFRLAASVHASRLFDHLGRRGILVRRFRGMPDRLRIGLPADDQAFDRLSSALTDWADR